MRRYALPILGLALAVAAASAWRTWDTLGGPESVVFIILDDVRADHTSLCGYTRPTTPRLEALAQAGAAYSCGVVAPGSWTLPSHASFFTGVPVIEHGAHELPVTGAQRADSFVPTGTGIHALPLDGRLPTLAEGMTARGLQARLISLNPVLGEASGLTRGFGAPVLVAPSFHQLDLGAALQTVLASLAPDGGPLFLVVNLTQAHQPWPDVGPEVPLIPPTAGFAYRSGVEDDIWTRWYTGQLSDAERGAFLSDLTNVYDAGIWRADAAMGAILDELEARGWCGRKCRVVVASDHGEMLGENGHIDHGFYVDEANARVPVLVRGGDTLPAVFAGAEVFDLVRDGARRATPLAVEQPAWGHAARWEGSGRRAYGSVSAARWGPDGEKVEWIDGQTRRYDLRTDRLGEHPTPGAADPALQPLVDAVRGVEVPASGSMAVEQLLEAAGYVEPR